VSVERDNSDGIATAFAGSSRRSRSTRMENDGGAGGRVGRGRTEEEGCGGSVYPSTGNENCIVKAALMRGQRARHYIHVSESHERLRSSALPLSLSLSLAFLLSLDSHQCASSIISRLTGQPIPASGSPWRISTIRPDIVNILLCSILQRYSRIA